MEITLDYGRQGLPIDVPDKHIAKILKMKNVPSVRDSQQAVAVSLQQPIGTNPLIGIATGREDACVVISDYTRPVPSQEILPPLFSTLHQAGIPADRIILLVACGIHAPGEANTLEEMVGKEIMGKYRVVNHLSQVPDELVWVGTTDRGTPITVNKLYYGSDLKILTGLIEPHFMAGYSGGRKSICPGICSLETMKTMHGPAILEHENTSNGILAGNLFHAEAIAIARRVGVDFILNVVINQERNIGGVFAGELEQAHEQGVAFCEEHIVDFVEQPVDIVVTSNAGYPLDSNYYQTVKGMVTALDIVKPGGTVIMASACTDGIGSAEFKCLLDETDEVDGFIQRIQAPGYFAVDQWEVEELCKALKKVEVYLYTEGLTKKEVENCLVKPIDSVEQGIELAIKKHGPNAAIGVIPQGPYVMGRIAS